MSTVFWPECAEFSLQRPIQAEWKSFSKRNCEKLPACSPKSDKERGLSPETKINCAI